jgi:hypothetical protein
MEISIALIKAKWPKNFGLHQCNGNFHCIDKGQVAENFAEKSVVFYFNCLFFPLEDNSDFFVIYKQVCYEIS